MQVVAWEQVAEKSLLDAVGVFGSIDGSQLLAEVPAGAGAVLAKGADLGIQLTEIRNWRPSGQCQTL